MRKKRENGMAKESGMGDFPRKQFESVLLHSLRIMDQNREYLQMHLARTGDERTRQALEDMGQESIRLERTLREMMGLLEVVFTSSICSRSFCNFSTECFSLSHCAFWVLKVSRSSASSF